MFADLSLPENLKLSGAANDVIDLLGGRSQLPRLPFIEADTALTFQS
jgi:hypothetical protein